MFFAQLPPSPAPLTQPVRPYRIQITLSDPGELQVSQGQAVQLGDILVVRSAERIQLETRRLEIQSQLLALENTPPPDTIVLQQRILAYQQAQTSYDQQYRIVTQLQQSGVAPSLLRQEILRLQSLYSELLTAHAQAQQTQLQHQQGTDNYRQEQTTQHHVLMGQLQIINLELNALSIRAPFAGSISRIRWLDQTNATLTVEITIQP
jgi:multidrug resistance efflux pump